MEVLLELFLFIGMFFPIYHVVNSITRLDKAKSFDKWVTILIPCYNESKILQTTIDGINRIDYNNYECIFINDGSTDDTIEVLKNILVLNNKKRGKLHKLKSKPINKMYQSNKYPNIYVIDKENGGKSDALNIGINYSKYEYIVTLDADSVLKKDALSIIMNKFDNHNVIATSGVIQIMQSFHLSKNNDDTTLKINNLLQLQTLEYIKACFIYKASLAKLGSLLVISGAFGCFKKDILLGVNGFKNVIGEDLDLTIRIQLFIKNTNKIISYCPNAICYTEGPEIFNDYIKQRKRWHHSFIEGLINYYKFLYKDTFFKTLSFFALFDAIIIGFLSSILIIIFTIVILINFINNNLVAIFTYFVIFIVINLIYDVGSLILANYYGVKYKKTDIFRLLYIIFVDIFFYRFITLYTVILGSVTYFHEHKNWNKVERSGRNYDALKD
jgi:biofilm PGA synthesis N-glycosyltransferase PgaC